MQQESLDWYLLNGFVADDLLNKIADVDSGFAFGAPRFSYLLSGGNPIGTWLLERTLGVLGFALRWMLLPALAVAAYYFEYSTVAYCSVGAYIAYIAYRLVSLPQRILNWKNVNLSRKQQRARLRALTDIHDRTRSETLQPTRLMEVIQEAEQAYGYLVNPAVYCILERAIERNPTFLTRNWS